MQEATTPARRAVWGLWVFFTAATIGFVVLIGGLFGNEWRATMAGAGLMAFATLVYLFIHFWTTAHAAFAPQPTATPTRAAPVRARTARPQAPSDGNPYNFEGLLSHTLERAPAPEAAGVPHVATGAAAHDERIVTAATNGQSRTHVVPAMQRRSEWIGGLPIIKQVLGETASVTSPTRPGKTRGQCSNCQTILWAPTARPIRLRCPQCNKVAWLEK